MAPLKTWIHVDELNLGKLQYLIDTAAVDALNDPVVFSVRAGQCARSVALATTVTKLQADLEKERNDLINEARKLREGIGMYAVKLRQANSESERALIGFELRSDTPGSVPDLTGA